MREYRQLTEEDSLLIMQFLKANPRLTLKAEKLTYPSALSPDHDGGYIATLSPA